MSEEHLVVDEHHADQLIVYMALAEGTSLMRTTKELSLHSKTMVQLLPMFNKDIKFEVILEEKTNTSLVVVHGIGL